MRITERRLRSLIRSVIAEAGYRVGDIGNPEHMKMVYRREQGFDKLKKEYKRLIPVGGTGQDFEEMLDNKRINHDDIHSVSREGNEVIFYVGDQVHYLKRGAYSVEIV